MFDAKSRHITSCGIFTAFSLIRRHFLIAKKVSRFAQERANKLKSLESQLKSSTPTLSSNIIIGPIVERNDMDGIVVESTSKSAEVNEGGFPKPQRINQNVIFTQ